MGSFVTVSCCDYLFLQRSLFDLNSDLVSFGLDSHEPESTPRRVLEVLGKSFKDRFLEMCAQSWNNRTNDAIQKMDLAQKYLKPDQ